MQRLVVVMTVMTMMMVTVTQDWGLEAGSPTSGPGFTNCSSQVLPLRNGDHVCSLAGEWEDGMKHGAWHRV